MDQKNIRNNKQLPKALNQEELRQIKGGYREIVGVAAGSQFVRWDEVDIRFDGGIDNLQGLSGTSIAPRSFRFGHRR